MKFFLVVCLLSILTSANGQFVEIKGKLNTESGEPASYVSIDRVKVGGKRFSTCSDKFGQFQILSEPGDSLKFTGEAYSEFRYGVSSSATIVVELTPQTYRVAVVEKSHTALRPENDYGGKLIKEQLDNTIFGKEYKDSVLRGNDKLFKKVGLSPALVLSMSLDSAFTRELDERKVKKEGLLELVFTLTANKTIENIQVSRSYNKTVDSQVMDNLKTAFILLPAIQNGSRVNVICKILLRVYKSNGQVRVEIINSDKG